MSGNGIAYEMNAVRGEQAALKVEQIFTKILRAVEYIKPLVVQAVEAGREFPNFEEDLNSILTACDQFVELVEKDRTSIANWIQANDLTEEHMKEARHDLRAKVGAILGYSELIQEELGDESTEAAANFSKGFGVIIEHANNLIPVIDGLRLDDLIQNEEFSTNENLTYNQGLVESNLPYGEQFADNTVLIIDDSPYNREILRRRLSRYGVKVITAEDGAAGLEVVSQKPVDLILLDIMMPVMNGYEVLTRLKSDPATKNIPVLMISALSEVDSIVRCIEVGAEDYLPTPFNPVVLHARIKACLEKKNLRDREQQNLDKLEMARKKLETAIESIDDGFAVFDHDERLNLCNEQFQRLYPGVERLGNHGFTYEQLLRKNMELGVYFEERRQLGQAQAATAQDVDNWVSLNEARQKLSAPYLVRLRDGRWIEIVNSATPDGGLVSVHKDVTNRKQDEDRLTYLAMHDALTGLANRASFEANLTSSFAANGPTLERFGLMFLDLDGFKAINDTLGHDVGDQVLYTSAIPSKSACVLQTSLRAWEGMNLQSSSELHVAGKILRTLPIVYLRLLVIIMIITGKKSPLV